MDILLIVLLASIFLYGIIYLYKLNKNIKVYARFSNFEKLVILLGSGILFFIAYKFGSLFIHYILVILGSISLFLMAITSGANENGFITQTAGRGFKNIKLIEYKDLRVVKIEEKEKYIRIEAPCPEVLIIMKFRLEDRKELLSLIKGVKVEIK